MASGEPSDQLAAKQRKTRTAINTENDLYQALEDDVTEVSMVVTTQCYAGNEQPSIASTMISDQVQGFDHANW